MRISCKKVLEITTNTYMSDKIRSSYVLLRINNLLSIDLDQKKTSFKETKIKQMKLHILPIANLLKWTFHACAI